MQATACLLHQSPTTRTLLPALLPRQLHQIRLRNLSTNAPVLPPLTRHASPHGAADHRAGSEPVVDRIGGDEARALRRGAV